MTPGLTLYRRADGKWAWRLVAPNGRIVATDGGQGYNNRADCLLVANTIIRGDYAFTPVHTKEPA